MINKSEYYQQIEQQLNGLLAGERDVIATLSNASALIYDVLDNVNWAGFYLLSGDTLVLGPFQGKVACVRIPVGRGVCGTAVARNTTLRIDDVHKFDGHIACDAQSNAEIVIPLVVNQTIIGVLDIDSTIFNRFDEEDEKGLQALTGALCKHLESCVMPKYTEISVD